MSHQGDALAGSPAARGAAPMGVPSPAQLWASSDTAVWSAVREHLDAAVEKAAASSKSKSGLRELDRWYRHELPAQLQAACSGSSDAQPHITRDQLALLVEWKMAWGQWRPRLLAYAREQPDGAVEEASGRALALLRGQADGAGGPPRGEETSAVPGAGRDDAGGSAGAPGGGPEGALRGAVEALAALKGVGPATASALLAAADPTVPYMGDEALAVCLPPGRHSDYSLKSYLQLAAALRDKAHALQKAAEAAALGDPVTTHEAGPPAASATRAAGREPGTAVGAAGGSPATGPGSQGKQRASWTASDVERCLWAAGVLHAAPSGAPKAAGKRAAAVAGGSGKGKRARR